MGAPRLGMSERGEESDAPTRADSPDATRRKRGPIRRFLAWFGFGLESDPPDEADSDLASSSELAESLERAETRAAEGARQAAVDGIRSLELELERAKREAAARFSELEGQLAKMRRRAQIAESGVDGHREADSVPAGGRNGEPEDPLAAIEALARDRDQATRSSDGDGSGVVAKRRRFRRLRPAKSRTG